MFQGVVRLDLNEGVVSTYLTAKLFNPGIHLFNLLAGKDLLLATQKPAYFYKEEGPELNLRTVSDYVIVNNNNNLVSIEVKRPMLLGMLYSIKPFKPAETFGKKAAEMIYQCLNLKTTFSIITDYYIIFFIEIAEAEKQNLKKHDGKKGSYNKIQINYHVMQYKDPNVLLFYTMFLKNSMQRYEGNQIASTKVQKNLESIGANLRKPDGEIIEEEKTTRENLKKCFESTEIIKSKSIGLCEMDLMITTNRTWKKHIIQFKPGKYNSSVFLFKKKVFLKLIDEGKYEKFQNLPEKDLIIKILDPVQVPRYNYRLSAMGEKCCSYFESEIRCYDRITREKKKRSFKRIAPDLYGYGFCSGVDKNILTSGLFMILEFIDGNNLKFNDYVIAEENLNYLHSLQIAHCDIKPANMKKTNKGEIFFFDFGFSSTTRRPYNKSKTKTNLLTAQNIRQDKDLEKLQYYKDIQGQKEKEANRNKKRKITKKK